MQRVVGDELGDRVGDAIEQVVEVLLGEDVVEDLGETTVRLDERRNRPDLLAAMVREHGSRSCSARAHRGGIGRAKSPSNARMHPNG